MYKEIWILEVLICLIVFTLANYGLKKCLKYLRRLSLSKEHSWQEKIEEVIYLPLHVVLWIFGMTVASIIIGTRFGYLEKIAYLYPLQKTTLIVCAAWLLLRWKTAFQSQIAIKLLQKDQTIDPGMSQIVGRLSSIAIVVITALIILQVFGLNIMPLVAFGGIGAAALGFAAKDVIANFFGSLMLHITCPFTVGDVIILPERNIEGSVEAIGWYLTSIRDKEKRPVYLPNALFASYLVINASRMSHRRLEGSLAIRYEDISKIPAIVEEIKQCIATHSAIDTHLPLIVSFNTFNQCSIDIYFDACVLATRIEDFYQVKQELLLNMHEIISKQGAQMPYPKLEILTRLDALAKFNEG